MQNVQMRCRDFIFLTTPVNLCISLGMQLALLLSLAWGAAVARADAGIVAAKHCESLDEQEAQRAVLHRINALRAAGAICGASTFVAADPLRWNVQLLQAAQSHSSDMAGNNYFSHSSPKGATMAQRVQASGYTYTRLGENIAAGQATASATLDGWMKSPGHCQNLMNPAFQDVALACVRNDQSRFRYYWTMNLGRP
jgi:uncharacterized protein YkwD